MAGVFTNIKQTIHSAYVKTAVAVMPTLSESKFIEEGVLTPEEFVAAGDLLVFKCKTWTWEAGDPDKAVPYLPKDKQFLLTRNVKCGQRCSKFEAQMEKVQPVATVKVEGDDDDWVTQASDAPKDEPIQDIAGGSCSDTAGIEPVPMDDSEDDEDDGPIPDMETFDGDNVVEEDPAAAKPASADDTIAHTRTYDISITYDYYYRTPKVWLFGYDEQGKPLKPAEVFEDISADHANKTVTMEAMPHTGIQHAYIHPCRHAAVMKKIIQKQVDAGKPIRVDQYIILFIKFISSVIPTIEYDYTMEIEG